MSTVNRIMYNNFTERRCIIILLHTHHLNDTPPPCQSIIQKLEQVMHQVEYQCFLDPCLNYIDPFYKEICLIIAEVFVLDTASFVKINGSNICVCLIQEVYSQLNNDHLRIVFDNFHHVPHRIYNKKSYLRTALYNVVFELESHFCKGYDA